MPLRRFVDRAGWEKWLDVPEPEPSAMKVLDEHDAPDFMATLFDPKKASPRVRTLVFTRARWKFDDGTEEPFYFEDHATNPRGPEVYAEGIERRPSLHREQKLQIALLMVKDVIRDEHVFGQKSPFSQALASMEACRRIWRLLHEVLTP